MQRRKALAIAGGVTVTALAAAFAIGANFGLFGLTEPADRVGTLRIPASAQLSSVAPGSSAGSAAGPGAGVTNEGPATDSSTTTTSLSKEKGGEQHGEHADHDEHEDEHDD